MVIAFQLKGHIMKLTYFGHSCFGIEINGLHLVFDPLFPAILEWLTLTLKQVNADYILISHGHEDHVDAEIIAKRTGAKLISNFEIINWFRPKALEKRSLDESWRKISFDFGTVQYVNAVHSSSMPDGSYGGESVGL